MSEHGKLYYFDKYSGQYRRRHAKRRDERAPKTQHDDIYHVEPASHPGSKEEYRYAVMPPRARWKKFFWIACYGLIAVWIVMVILLFRTHVWHLSQRAGVSAGLGAQRIPAAMAPAGIREAHH